MGLRYLDGQLYYAELGRRVEGFPIRAYCQVLGPSMQAAQNVVVSHPRPYARHFL